jgi:hypothetical protein
VRETCDFGDWSTAGILAWWVVWGTVDVQVSMVQGHPTHNRHVLTTCCVLDAMLVMGCSRRQDLALLNSHSQGRKGDKDVMDTWPVP